LEQAYALPAKYNGRVVPHDFFEAPMPSDALSAVS
jgi:hypothetical protein